MTELALSIGLFLLIAGVLYCLGVYAIRLADARYDRSSGESRRKNLR